MAVLIGVMLAMAGFTLYRTTAWRSQARDEERQRAEDELRGLVDLWEGLVSDRVAAWLADLPDTADRPARELESRNKVQWFDAWYLWVDGKDGPRLVYPQAAPEEDVQSLLRRTPCMSKAHDLQVVGRREEAAQAFLGCVDGTDAERLLATDLAASLLVAAGKAPQAVSALGQVDPPVEYPLGRAGSRGLSPQRLLHRRATLAQALAATGQGQRRNALLADTVTELTDLSGPDLVALLPRAARILEQDLSAAVPAERLEALARREARAQRRVVGYQEVSARLATMVATADGDPPKLRFVHDMYSDPGFLLAWAPLRDGRMGAVHLDVATMLENLVRDDRRLGRDRPLVVLDARGERLLPRDVDMGGMTTVATVPLGRMLPQYRLALLAPEVDQTRELAISTVLSVLPVVVATVLGVIALAIQVAASRRERELYQRQQDFIARVTHELKTPLAGIKVMAETLEMGAAEDPASAALFLGRILQEANNLEKRIDEVLLAARRPKVSATTPVRLDALAGEVVRAWKPRFAQAGGTLEADLRPCQPVPGDAELLRDALNNLLDNSLKYQRPGVRLKAQVRTGEMGRWVVFEVSDNGIGVPPAMRKRIFERFQRVEGPGRGKAGGHGLGLSFVADTAAAHGGLVECTDAPDGGARFRLKLRRRG